MFENNTFRRPDPPCRTIRNEQVKPYLAKKFGFDVKILLNAVSAGYADAALSTRHSPVTSFGSRFWEGSIRELRDTLVPEGWRSLRPGQLEVVRNQGNTVQIATALGDHNVGNRSMSPSCEHPRGASTAQAVAVNQTTFAGLAPSPSWEPIETWWLLYRPSINRALPVRCELSLPVVMTGNRITDWAVRILLPTPVDETRHGAQVTLPTDPPPIGVTLKRRAV